MPAQKISNLLSSQENLKFRKKDSSTTKTKLKPDMLSTSKNIHQPIRVGQMPEPEPMRDKDPERNQTGKEQTIFDGNELKLTLYNL